MFHKQKRELQVAVDHPRIQILFFQVSVDLECQDGILQVSPCKVKTITRTSRMRWYDSLPFMVTILNHNKFKVDLKYEESNRFAASNIDSPGCNFPPKPFQRLTPKPRFFIPRSIWLFFIIMTRVSNLFGTFPVAAISFTSCLPLDFSTWRLRPNILALKFPAKSSCERGLNRSWLYHLNSRVLERFVWIIFGKMPCFKLILLFWGNIKKKGVPLAGFGEDFRINWRANFEIISERGYIFQTSLKQRRAIGQSFLLTSVIKRAVQLNSDRCSCTNSRNQLKGRIYAIIKNS